MRIGRRTWRGRVVPPRFSVWTTLDHVGRVPCRTSAACDEQPNQHAVNDRVDRAAVDEEPAHGEDAKVQAPPAPPGAAYKLALTWQLSLESYDVTTFGMAVRPAQHLATRKTKWLVGDHLSHGRKTFASYYYLPAGR